MTSKTHNNVIDFNSIRTKKMQEKLDKLVEESIEEEEYIADFALNVVGDLIEALSEFGYDVMDNPDCIRDVITVIESIRGLMHRIRGEEYPMQTLSDSIYDQVMDEDVTTKEVLINFLEGMDFVDN